MKNQLIILVLLILLTAPTIALADPIIVDPGDGGSGVNTTKPDGQLPIEYRTPGYSTSTGGTITNQTVTNIIKIVVNGVEITPDVAPFVDSANRTQAPFRAIGEALGCKVSWDEKTQTVTCEKEGFKVEMVIGKKQFTINGAAKTMDTVPIIKNGRTFIPVRALSEALDCNVNWDEASKTVNISAK